MSGSNGAGRPRVAIIGAGFSGVAVAHRLRESGIPFTIFEKGHEVGGTWRENTYPGLKCDVPLFGYCLSWAPGQGGWTKLLAPGSEIQRQLVNTVDQHDLRQHVRLNAEVVECRWDDDAWVLTTADAEHHRYEVVVHATGFLHQPNVPKLAGLESFAGPVLHTAKWDHSVEHAGKRVGVIGTGSSGVQVTSAMSETSGALTLFQRTAQWIFPLPDVNLPKPFVRVLDRSPRLARWVRRKVNDVNAYFLGRASIGDCWQRRFWAWIVRTHLRSVRDPELRAILTPTYPPLCKRTVMSSSFYKAVQRPNVTVVPYGVDHIRENGVVTTDGRLHELDVLVLATGFDSHAYMRPMKVIGEDGVTVDDLWREGVFSYRTIGLPKMPNLYMIMGPYSCLTHVSPQETAEAQAGYIANAVEEMRTHDLVSLTPTQAATDTFLHELAGALPSTVWTQCVSWYVGKNDLPVMWPWSREHFFEIMQRPNLADFDVRTVAATAATAGQ